jgi:TctA family transporter
MLDHLALGFSTAVSTTNLLYCLFGVTIGTFVGVLPGIGPVAALSMLLPVTFTMPPVGAIIMLAGIYYGTQYGGSTTAILVNVPGDAASVVTCLDGHALAKSGRAGAALAVAALSSFFAGCVGTAAIALVGPPLAQLAFSFRSPEYFSLMVLGLVMACLLAQRSPIKSIGMVLLGLLLGCVGTDVNSGLPRFTFGSNELLDGISFSVLAMGLFAVSETIVNLQRPASREMMTKSIGPLMMSSADFKGSWRAVLRGTAVGGVFGILPGVGPVVASFAAYVFEKRVAKDASRFGRGAIEGVAAPEAANNMAAQTSFIPTLTLGLPGSATMALLLGAMIIQGIAPGPNVITKYPELFWGLIVSMWIGNAFLVILNLPLIPIWVRMLMVPYRWLWPTVLLICCIGTFSASNRSFDVLMMGLFGALGFLLLKLDCEPAPLLLGFVLGPMMEEHMRRALLISRGDFSVFVTRPISLVLLLATLALMVHVVLSHRRQTRGLDEQS